MKTPDDLPRLRTRGGCPVCRSSAIQTRFDVTDRRHGVPGTYSYAICASCESAYQDPAVVDEDLSKCYPGNYYAFSSTPSRSVLRTVRIVGAKLGVSLGLGSLLRGVVGLHMVARPGERRALDVGCGAGGLLGLLTDLGWIADGVEPDPAAARIAATRTRGDVITGMLSDVTLENGSYDLIVLNHVIEHTGRPGEVIDYLYRLLRPGTGRLVMMSPNPSSLGRRAYGTFWFPWEAPRHLTLPSAKGFRLLLGRLEWNELRVLSSTRNTVGYLRESEAFRGGASRWRPLLYFLRERFATLTGNLDGEELLVIARRG